jgi:hypothetical protein
MVEELPEFTFSNRSNLTYEILKSRNLELGILDFGRLIDDITQKVVYEGYLAAISHQK